jgi:hypothetical protein
MQWLPTAPETQENAITLDATQIRLQQYTVTSSELRVQHTLNTL